MKFVGFVLIVLSMWFTGERAEARACLTSLNPGGSEGVALNFTPQGAVGVDSVILKSGNLSCQELDAWKMGLKAATYTFNIASLGLACTAVGAPVSVGMFGVGFVLYTAELVVDSLPCDDGQNEKNEQLIRNEVCLALEAQGIACDPHLLQRR
jgi:hypothetical protein